MMTEHTDMIPGIGKRLLPVPLHRLLGALLLLAVLCGLPRTAAADTAYGVMCYHDVVEETAGSVPEVMEFQGELHRQYYPQTISVHKLTAHFNWLRDNGYTPVSWQQIADARAGRGRLPAKPVLLTFDDGYISFYTKVYPLLQAYRYPAVLAVVTSWMETPQSGSIAYGSRRLPRSAFVTWEQIREMQAGGLVEVASHTHDLHRSNIGNPLGSLFAAALPGKYEHGRYETAAEYGLRIRRDLQRSMEIIERHTGRRPRLLVWPYGQFNETAVDIARQVGLEHDFTLFDHRLNRLSEQHVGRILIDHETDLRVINAYLNGRMFEPQTQRAVHVDLDYVYDANPAQQSRNLDQLVERISRMGVSSVYLQAFADDDGNGVAEALYFPNRHLPVKADLFSRAAWQLATRAEVKVYAWMPMMAFDLGSGYDYVTDSRSGRPAPAHYLRLSPYSAKNRRTVAEIYEDLAFHSRFNGILFHDDGFLTDFEGHIASGARDDARYWQEAQQKTDDLIRYTDELKQAVLRYSFKGRHELKTARNLYAGVVMNPQAQQWFAQSLPRFARHYDYTAIMAMPYLENRGQTDPARAAEWLRQLAGRVKQQGVPLNRVVFELQTTDWQSKRPVPDQELVHWMRLLKQEGIQNLAYYPDDFPNNRPAMSTVKPVFSIQR